MSSRCWGSVVVMLVAATALLAEPPTTDQLLSKNTVAFVRIETGELWRRPGNDGLRQWLADHEDNLLEEMERNLGFGPDVLDRVFVVMQTDETGRPPRSAVLLTLSKPCDRERVKKGILRPATTFQRDGEPKPPEPKLLEEPVGSFNLWRFEPASEWSNALCFFDDRHVLMGELSGVKAVLQGLATPSPSPLQAILKRTQGTAFAAAMNVELIPGKEKNNVPLPFNTLMKARLATITIKLTDGLEVRGEGEFASDAEAKAAATALTAALGLAKGSMPMLKKEMQQQIVDDPDAPLFLYELWPNLEKALGELKPAVEGSTVTLQGKVLAPPGQLVAFPLMAIMLVGARAEATFQSVGSTIGGGGAPAEPRLPRTQSGEALKQIAAALEKYQAHEKRYPPAAILSADGKPLLSWRVALLPYLGEEDLYREFKLDEPWNSPHNRKLIERLPAAYKPEYAYRGRTPFRLILGEQAAFTAGAKTGPAIADFIDGAGNTVLIAEANHSVAWTRPEGLRLIADFPLPRMQDDTWNSVGGSQVPQGFYAVMADGTVRFFEKKADNATRRALFTRAGRESVAAESLGKVIK